MLPQDEALLLTDPRTSEAATGGVESTGGLGLTLVAVGAVLVVTGLLMLRSTRG